MKSVIYIPIICFALQTFFSCNTPTEQKHTTNTLPEQKPSPSEPHPDSACNTINHCLIMYGFDYESVKTVVFRTYKKGTNFKKFIKEFKSVMDRDFLAEEPKDSWNNKRKKRDIYIPDEINADVDFIIVIAGSIEYRVSEIESDWEQFYGNEYLGWNCDMKSYKVNGIEGNSNIRIYKVGYTFPR